MLAAGVAHEINNPLAYIIFNLESLAGQITDRAQRLLGIKRALLDRLGDKALSETLGTGIDAIDPDFWSDVAACLNDALAGSRKI